MKNIEAVIRAGIAHIAREQRPDGGFASLSSPDPVHFSAAVRRLTTFFTANMLSCLCMASKVFLDSGQAVIAADIESIKKKCAEFLAKEKGERGSFNYWSRRAKEHEMLSYPDDLDDTFAALGALALHDRSLIGGNALAQAVRLLTALEIKEGGPYRTWLVPADAPQKWRDTDIVVNSTIGWFLSLFDVSLPNLEAFIAEILEKNGPVSPYYPGPVQALYFVSRFYQGRKREDIAELILDCRKNPIEWRTPLENAMAITSLVRLGFREKVRQEMIGSLVLRIRKEGWRPYPFCMDPVRGGKPHYAGSPALTAAFVVEVLSLQKEHREDFTRTHKRIRAMALRECRNLPVELRVQAFLQIEKTDDIKITELVYRFRDALGMKGRKIPRATADRLALGSLYGWMAYTIYDDILDGDRGPFLLPCANVLLRKLARVYTSVAETIPAAQSLFDRTMNMIDAANAWEYERCRIDPKNRNLESVRLPDFGDHRNCADRSIGHALAPLTLLAYLGYGPDAPEHKAARDFFRHYFIARQIHDDARDWEEDLRRGRINAIGALILSKFRKSAQKSVSDASIIEFIPRLHAFFKQAVIDEAVALILFHVQKARHALAQCAALEDISYFDARLRALEAVTRKILEERDTAKAFLRAYKRVQAVG